MALSPFIFDATKGETPETVALKRALAARLLGGVGGGAANSVGAGIGNAFASIGAGIGANVINQRARSAEQQGQQEATSLYDSLVSGLTTGSPVKSPSAPASGDMSAYQNAISGIESGGKYDAVGPAHPQLGRALGKYQVMEANIGPWSKAALGREVTPQEFLQNPQLQDQVFNHQFGQYVEKYGPQGAAQAWFAGPGGIGSNRQDSLGTSVPEYTRKFNAAMGGDQAQMPQGASPTAGGPQAAPQPQQQAPGGMNLQQLMQAASNPWLNDSQRSVINGLIQQQMQAQDPRRQLELQKTQLEVEALRNPQAKPTDDMREYEAAKNQGYTGTFLDYQQTVRKAGASNTNVTVGEGDKFYENLDKKNAETFATLSENGMTGRSRVAQLNQLEQLITQAPTGAGANIKLWLGDMGIKTEGLDDLQATRALIEKMVPEQRAPGSGPMSDADIAMYRNSLPNVMNQPGGNNLIIGTAKAIAEYDMQMGQIADSVADRTLSPAEGRKAIRELKNPLDGYREQVRSMMKSAGGAGPSGAPAVPPPVGHIQDGHRFKGGNPADPNSWEQVL